MHLGRSRTTLPEALLQTGADVGFLATSPSRITVSQSDKVRQLLGSCPEPYSFRLTLTVVLLAGVAGGLVEISAFALGRHFRQSKPADMDLKFAVAKSKLWKVRLPLNP